MNEQESVSSTQEADLDRLKEMVLDHLGLPRPGMGEHIQRIQDQLLPTFMEVTRQTWLATSPMTMPDSPVYPYLQEATEVVPQHIHTLNNSLEEMGVHDLLRDMAVSSEAAMLDKIPLDPYETRLLRAAGHPKPADAPDALLRRAAQDPSTMAAPSARLNEAADITLSIHGDFYLINNPPRPDPNELAANKPKKRKLFSGLGQLFSGTVLMAGNALIIPSVPAATVTAIPVVGSLAAGIVAVGEGAGQLRGENE